MSNSVKEKFLADPTRYSEEAYASLRQQLLTIERKYAKGVPKFENLFAFMASAHEQLGLIAYFARGDKLAFKQHWYLASKLLVVAAKHIPADDDFNTAGVSMDTNLLYALVSDGWTTINEFAHLETNRLSIYRNNPNATEFNFHLAQLIIRGDYEAAQAKIQQGTKKAGGKIKQAYVTGTDYYSLLMKGDKAGLEASIMDSTRFRKS